jgi:peptidoglycan L-alanyl-D-glutamate endopeptidase CwlK
VSLVNEQFEFVKDVIKLLEKAIEMDLVVTLGEAHRPIEMQELYIKTGRSKTMNSMHLKRCAIDLNFFKDGKLTYDITLLKPLGDYWESLNTSNQWGGNWKKFKDVPHFERKV